MKKEDLKVLYIDDEEGNLTTFRIAFSREFTVLTCNSAQSAFEILQEHGEIPIIITDQRMPEMTGIEFLGKILPDYPDSIRIVLSGFTDTTALIDAINTGKAYRYIVKPWDSDELKQTLKVAFDHYFLFKENQNLVAELKLGNKELKKHQERLDELVRERTAELAIAKERAEEKSLYKSVFLAAMSHELRTPLNSIIGFTGIVLQGLAGPLNDEQTKQLTMVRGSARHLLNIINDVLDITEIEAGQMESTSELFDMREVVEKVVRTMTPLAEKKGLVLATKVAPEVGQVTGDRRRVEQILINLVNNAIKFTEQGEVRVECQVNDSGLVTRVVDTGIGIKPEDMDKLFEAFQQVETGLGRRHEGTGLGLSICKKLLEMLSGEIWVESEWGVGSTFTFTLPVKIGGRDETKDTRH